MATPLEKLLREIEPVPDEMDRVFDRALNTFPAPPAVIQDWDAYASLLGRFHHHLEKAFYGRPPPSQDERAHCALSWALLSRELGRSAEHAAFEIARTGAEGGIRGLLRTAARLYSEDKAEQRVSGLVAEYWNRRSTSERWADADEYIARYRHALPSEMTEDAITRIHVNLFKVLQQHPFVMRRLRRTTG